MFASAAYTEEASEIFEETKRERTVRAGCKLDPKLGKQPVFNI